MSAAISGAEYRLQNSFAMPGLQEWFEQIPGFSLVDSESSARAEAEHYIRMQFNKSYGANPSHLLRQLLTLRCGEKLSGAAGVCVARQSIPLFLEQYLDAPVECELARLGHAAVARRSVAEVGNLVATSFGASRLVFVVLASMLQRAGIDWMVFTATAPLRHSLSRLGFSMQSLQSASPNRLSDTSADEWGTYYQHAPEVTAGRVDQAVALIRNRRLFAGLQSLFQEQITELAVELKRDLQ